MTEYGIRVHSGPETAEEWFGEDRAARDSRLLGLMEQSREPGSLITGLGQLDKPDFGSLAPVPEQPEPE